MATAENSQQASPCTLDSSHDGCHGGVAHGMELTSKSHFVLNAINLCGFVKVETLYGLVVFLVILVFV